jgi:CheY-like chemotaxis protein
MSMPLQETYSPLGGPPGRRHRVLVLESDRLIESLIVEWLHMAGNEAVCTHGMGAASSLGNECDLVLADVPAPHRAARQVVAHLREAIPDIPIIAMSADVTTCGQAAREALARELGAAALLVKPFTQEALLYAIHRARA